MGVGMWQYSLRAMLVAFFVFAILLLFVRLIPLPVSVFLVGAMPAPILSIMVASRRRFRTTAIVTMCLAAWLAFYVVSIGPVAGLGMWFGLETDPVSQKYFRGVYTPVISLCQSTFLARPIELYIDFWQHLALKQN
jgi:hypothetical protein